MILNANQKEVKLIQSIMNFGMTLNIGWELLTEQVSLRMRLSHQETSKIGRSNSENSKPLKRFLMIKSNLRLLLTRSQLTMKRNLLPKLMIKSKRQLLSKQNLLSQLKLRLIEKNQSRSNF